MTSARNRAEAIVAGRSGDPFAYLGPHRRGKKTLVRTFQPGAAGVTVTDADRDDAAVAAMSRIHDAGLFEAAVDALPGHYRLQVEWPSGAETVEDPYRFPPILGELDLHLLGESRHREAYRRLGAHPATVGGVAGVTFVVWAPNASRVSVIGDFNAWDGRRHPMRRRHEGGMWEIFVPAARPGMRYKFELLDRHGHLLPAKADPFAVAAEEPPQTASIIQDLGALSDREGEPAMRSRPAQRRDAPMSIYEVHLGSWRRRVEEGDRPLSYLELAEQLVGYVSDMGFTHVEFLPVTEYPFGGSWGYQPTGMFAPTRRYGSPEDFRHLVDSFHRAGIGVILDWVPGHFPDDPHGLARFDGTQLYEHADPRQGWHADWNTCIYNYGRAEVANFLLASALFWMDVYGIDGLRLDAVASMLYLDYSRRPGEWVPNRHGGNENLEAIHFLRQLNADLYARFPHGFTVAEESTAWPGVSRPVHLGGLGFGYKWNMGWMHDTLQYISRDPIHRRYHHDEMTFGLVYAFSENFVLPLSHDEVVHGKGSLLGRMPGDRWQRFANLRAYLGFMYAHPGKKLLFMGGEIAQEREWSHDRSLDWHLLEDALHRGVQSVVRDLNRIYREEPSLHQLDCEAPGFEWIDGADRDNSVYSFLRRGHDPDDGVIVVCNFTPLVRHGYRVGVPWAGAYREIFNSDASAYGGSGAGNAGRAAAQAAPWHGRPFALELTLPPLACLLLKPDRGGA